MDTLGIYVQIPFCASKCSFCNFNSKVAPQSVFDAYCDALEKEIASLPLDYAGKGILPAICDLAVDTLYFGGGTPSLLGAERLQRIVHTLRGRFKFIDSPEFTIEVTPGSVDDYLFSAAPGLGINRLSIGAQSFDDRELNAVGRLHTSAETRELVGMARRAGFKNISLDLIAGMPFQTESSWLVSVKAALDLRPEHISIYLFEVDQKSRLGVEVLNHGTRFHAATVPDDDFMAAAYETAQELLAGASYIQYEISNFAFPGYESRHNQKYWQLKPYVGLGAGAHSFDGVRRWANETAVETYQEKVTCAQSPIAEARVLSIDEQLEEFFFLGLRQRDGVDLQVARRHWGDSNFNRWEPRLSALARDGWIEMRADRVSLPVGAYLISNEIFQEFLLE
jgi:oxygen-independent coproporphyrinogen-3 oxidase